MIVAADQACGHFSKPLCIAVSFKYFCLYLVYTMMKKLVVREQVVKTVVRSGNGGAVWVPKDWLGEEVVVTLPERPRLGFKERIIRVLEPHLKDVVAVAVYGSYARKEQERGSDVDVLVVTNTAGLKLREKGMDVFSLPLDRLRVAIEKYPAMYYQIVQEAVPMINAPVFDELKSVKISNVSFKPYFVETKEHLKSSRELLELDKVDGEFVKSYSVLYSAMLRLRTLFIVRCILANKTFSNRRFKDFLLNKCLSASEFSDSYSAYRLVRDEISPGRFKIKTAVAEKLLNILEAELKALESKIGK